MEQVYFTYRTTTLVREDEKVLAAIIESENNTEVILRGEIATENDLHEGVTSAQDLPGLIRGMIATKDVHVVVMDMPESAVASSQETVTLRAPDGAVRATLERTATDTRAVSVVRRFTGGNVRDFVSRDEAAAYWRECVDAAGLSTDAADALEWGTWLLAESTEFYLR